MTRRSAYRLGDNAFVKVEQGELGQILPGIFLRIYHCINTTGMFMERFVELESVGTDLKSQLGMRVFGLAKFCVPCPRPRISYHVDTAHPEIPIKHVERCFISLAEGRVLEVEWNGKQKAKA